MDERATGQPIRFEHYRVATDEQGRPLKLGEGAMGVTYLAEDTNLKVRVALKVIRPQLLGDAEVGQRFQREAQAAARLRHPNVAGVYHLGMVDNTFFYAMEFVEGETVKDRVQRSGPMAVKEALEATLQVCEALGAAEKHKMVHRDIKPANIMLEPVEDDIVRVKLIDFGLAKPLHAEAQNSLALQTQAGIFLGTPVFASPEQVQDVPPDSRSDFYALGLTLWFMLEGRTPFEGSLHKVLFDQVHTAPPLGRLLWVPAEVRDLLGKMLEKDPANRPQTAKELRQKIHDCLRALATSGTSYTEWQQRFQVEGKPSTKPWGMIYEGQDTLSGAVRLHLLRHDRFSDPKAIQGVIADARRAIDIHHPNILRHLTVFPTSGGQGAGWMVVTEHPGNQTLLDHLRKVKQMPASETLAIMERLASAVDTCIANDLITADLDPSGIYLKQVPRTEIHALTQTAAVAATAAASSATSLTSETFEVVPKLSPINYAVLTTLRPADETAIGLTQGPFRMEATSPQELVQRLALLAYQCLGGAVPSTWSRVPRFIPLASLTQRQNDTLRAALTDSTWTRAADFVEAFQQTKTTTRRASETSRVTTAAEATVMLTSWRMLADLAAADSGEFSTEHAEEFTGKIEKQQEPATEAAAAKSESGNTGAAPQEFEPTAQTNDVPELAAVDAPVECTAQAAATTLNPMPSTEQTQTWSRIGDTSEEQHPTSDEARVSEGTAAAASITDLSSAHSVSTTSQSLLPDETETIILPSRTAQLLVTSAPPEITNEDIGIKEEAAAEGRTGAPNEASTPWEAPESPSPADESAGASPLAESDATRTTTSSSSADTDTSAVNETITSLPSEEPEETEGLETRLEAADSTSRGAEISSSGTEEKAERFSQGSDREERIQEATPDVRSSEPATSAGASALLTKQTAASPPSVVVPPSVPPVATSAIPLPPLATVPSAATSAPHTRDAALPDSNAQRTSRPRWLLPAAAALVVAVLIAGTALWMGDHGDPPANPDKETPPVVVNPPEPPAPPPAPPAGPTMSELLATAGNAAVSGDLPALDETLGEIREKFPAQSWEADPTANAFRDKLFQAYREKKLGNGTEAVRKYHHILLAATLAKESDIPLLKQICEDLSSTADAGRAEPFEKALLNSLDADEARKEECMKEALLLIKRRPESTVSELGCGILSDELKKTVDFLEQVPRDDSQEEYLKNAIPTLVPHLKEIADAGVAEACYILGDRAYRANKPADAERHFERGADLLHAPSMRRYGNAVTNALGSRPADMTRAAYYLGLASAQGDAKAKLLLADICLPQRPGVSRPWRGKEGEKLLKEAMEARIPAADYLYGAMLLDFEPNDPHQPFALDLTGKERKTKAVEHLRKAVAGNVSPAYLKLALALLTDKEMKDIAGAKDLLEKGTQLNPPNPFCMLYLSELIRGNHAYDEKSRPFDADDLAKAGILADPVKAQQLYTKAINLLREAAKNNQADAIQWFEDNGIPYK